MVHVVGKDESCVYSASVSEQELKSQETQLCVGVYDKKTKSLKLCPAAFNGHIFALSQSVPSYTSSYGQEANGRSEMSATETRKALFEDFGSAKKRKVLKSQEANRVNVDSVIGAGNLMVGSFLDGEGMSESNRKAVEERRTLEGNDVSAAAGLSQNDASVEAWRRGFLPKFNKDSQEPFRVYDPKDISGEETWEYLSRVIGACLRKDDPVGALTQTSSQDDDRNNQWVGSALKALHNLPLESQHSPLRMKVSLLLNHFVKLYGKFHRRRKIPAPTDSGRFFGSPFEIANRFLSEYATQVPHDDGTMSYVMSKGNKDKCCLHLLILYVMASSWPTMKSDSLKEIADDMQIDMRTALNLIRHAGFTSQGKSNKTIVQLKTPLVFPKISRGGVAKRS